ncbi:hypothetical protein M404DRAFT_378999 [Pisolithus tinctorius Marx 270]|uniref:Fungal STAND N-terminal Goodbye domain-containing protein n=1 Tax=Pisolithus tinctorius Marx 270 TaxID=870435 RepID=A0A0C3PJ11_PISTI|nr:hypothetical protein M404DRAFT_378999 [Pisolithus tinctorius Marx 270]
MLDAYGADTVVRPLGNTSEGSEVDAVRQALFVAQTNTATVNIPNLNTYLQYLTRFNAVITNIANAHPYAQMALVILTSAARFLLNQDDQDRAVSHLLETLSTVYKFLLEEDTVRSFDNMKETLGKIAQVASDAAQFILSYSETKNFWKTLGKNITSETRTKADGYVKLLNSLMQQYQDLAIQNILTSMHHVLEDLNFVRGELGLIHGGSRRDEIGRHGLCRCGCQ